MVEVNQGAPEENKDAVQQAEEKKNEGNTALKAGELD